MNNLQQDQPFLFRALDAAAAPTIKGVATSTSAAATTLIAKHRDRYDDKPKQPPSHPHPTRDRDFEKTDLPGEGGTKDWDESEENDEEGLPGEGGTSDW